MHGEPLSVRRGDGTSISEADLTVENLVWILDNAKNGFIRARAAQKLRNHSNLGVPESLLEIITTDENLWTRMEAFSSFERITGFKRNDIFDFESAASWYEDNRIDVAKRLDPLPDVAAPSSD